MTPEEQQKLIPVLEKEGYHRVRYLENQGLCGIAPMAFTVGIAVGLDEYSYSGRYCYGSAVEAVLALEMWNGQGDPPLNWIKYKGRGGERWNPAREKPDDD